VLRSPKGWSGPSEIHGDKLEGFWRSHLVPLSKPRQDPEELAALEAWMRSYRPEGLFYQEGRLRADLRELSPKGNKRMGSNPHANGGLLRKNLTWPSVDELAVIVEVPGQTEAENTYPLGQLLRELIRHNQGSYRLFGPDETHSNRLQAVCDATKKVWMANYLPEDLDGSELSMDGAVVEMLSEHTLVGMMEGYLLTGR
jgi:xylulose-5-phosphate/fructose-6-phosphate phosphoketolase